MKKYFFVLQTICLFFIITACSTLPSTGVDENRIHVTIVHFNDIYEITPISGGLEGGIARVATLRNQLLTRNPNTITTLGGDLFSPSAVGTASYQGDRLAGRQMVDVMNHFGLNYATFGNHEFDIKENQFKQRLQEAKFTWISSNVLNADGRSLSNVHQNLIIPFTDKKSGKSFKIGIFGLTLTTNKPDYISYTDPLTTAGNQVRQLAKTADFIIALTHQTMDDDIQLLQAYPQIALLLGGHEHTNFQNWRGNFTPLLKADANVRSVYVIDIYYHLQTGKTEIKPTFVPINDTLTEDTTVKAVVDQWMKIAFDAFREQGFQPEQVVAITKESLDGLASNVRSTSTNLTQLIAQSMLRAYPDTDLSIYNSGSIRIDDILPVGNITVYDVIRILPFGGNVQLASIKGHLLIKILNQGIANTGTGGFLQSANTQYINNTWHINHAPIDPQKAYKLAINDFLASGKEQGLSYLNANNKNFVIINQGKKQDIRQLVIDQLKIN